MNSMNTNECSGLLIMDGGNVQIVRFYVLRLVKTMPNESEKKNCKKKIHERVVSLLTLIKTISHHHVHRKQKKKSKRKTFLFFFKFTITLF